MRVRVAVSGIHAGDLGKRQGMGGSAMPFPRVIPHGDGARVTDAVGAGVPAGRIGQRVWVFLAQSYRPYGTAAEFVTFPAGHAIPLAGHVPFDQGAVFGIPAPPATTPSRPTRRPPAAAVPDAPSSPSARHPHEHRQSGAACVRRA